MAQMYRALWRHAAGRRSWLVASLVTLLVAELLKLLCPWLAARGLDVLQTRGFQDLRQAGMLLALMFAALLASWLFHFPGRLLERNLALHVRAHHFDWLLQRLLHAPLAWHGEQQTGELAQRLSQSNHSLYGFVQEQYLYIKCIVLAVGPLVALWWVSPLVGWLALFGYGSIALFGVRLDGRLIRLAGQENQADQRFSATLFEVLAYVATFAALRRRAGGRRLLMRRLEDSNEPLRGLIVWNELKWGGIELLCTCMWCLLVVIYIVDLARQSGNGQGVIALGGLFMVYQYTQQIDGVVAQLAGQFGELARQRADHASAASIEGLPDARPEPVLAAQHWARLHASGVYRLAPDGKTILADVNLVLERGLRYGLVGSSGAGKTTLLRLLAGLDQPSAGRIELDGQGADADRLQGQATLVGQQVELIQGSVLDNLVLGAMPSELGLDEAALPAHVQHACITAGVQEFLAPLAQGLDTWVDDAGANWSGGQRQRLALARGVLAAQAGAIVLLDEPTAGLDPRNEQAVFQRLMADFQGQTVVVALHRLELLEAVDQVIVMKAGRVVSVGTSQALSQHCEEFRQLTSE